MWRAVPASLRQEAKGGGIERMFPLDIKVVLCVFLYGLTTWREAQGCKAFVVFRATLTSPCFISQTSGSVEMSTSLVWEHPYGQSFVCWASNTCFRAWHKTWFWLDFSMIWRRDDMLQATNSHLCLELRLDSRRFFPNVCFCQNCGKGSVTNIQCYIKKQFSGSGRQIILCARTRGRVFDFLPTTSIFLQIGKQIP